LNGPVSSLGVEEERGNGCSNASSRIGVRVKKENPGKRHYWENPLTQDNLRDQKRGKKAVYKGNLYNRKRVKLSKRSQSGKRFDRGKGG